MFATRSQFRNFLSAQLGQISTLKGKKEVGSIFSLIDSYGMNIGAYHKNFVSKWSFLSLLP